MFAIKHIVQLHVVLSFLFAFVLADDVLVVDEGYDPSEDYNPLDNYRPRNVTGLGDFYSWVGSYYNATAEVELEFVFGWQYGEPLCSQWENHTHTAKFNAILSILEKGNWNSGNNSAIFWLTLFPQSSPPVNASSLRYRDMGYGEDLGISYPIYSASFLDHTYWVPGNSNTLRPMNGSSPDLFNFNTSQASGGAYNISGTAYPHRDLETPSLFANFSGLPVCDSTKQTSESRIYMMPKPSWDGEGWNDFQYPHTSIQFDDKTANLTLASSFHSIPIVHENQTSQGPTAHGFLRVRFSGALDAYHSDSLSLNGSTPSWLRTVGFSNNSFNIGYSESSVEKLHLGLGLASMAAMITVTMTLI
ncbi:hypothetical protein FLAG1_08072 [Fusarium langsethiae]|uniref:Uncharacterized protein n=1 Tax=Fusarium langsethiae TaxID=179993 RepID=A0A0M9ESN0_FUSLA|nr:hypothetical protein FLAG1_08072 [Fusarium langsethiae]GKU08321.1 unnamed protein product [Fusarium langsethiae]GKU13006.1 unnamed protein product [Fusarium langsethiae]